MSQKILIVDDDIRITDLLSEFFSEAGYKAVAVNDSSRAVETAKTLKPDLITLDLEMPGKDGVQVLKELRACSDTARVPVVIISIVAREARMTAESVQGIFDKPIRFARLIKEIQRILEAPASIA